MIKRIKQSKTLLSLSILIIVLLLVIIARITYAYLKRNIVERGQANVHIDADKLYALEFIPGNDLNISINSQTLIENGSDLEKVSKPRVELRDPVSEHVYSYYVYLNITGSDFVYTNGEENPEIILTISGPDGEIQEIAGLPAYNTALGGFDITQTKGLFPIVEQKEMHTEDSKLAIQEWTFTLKYRNFNVDQSANLNKRLNIEIIMQKEVIPTSLADVCSAEDKASECVQELASKSNYKLTNIVYHNTADATEKEIPNAAKVAGDDSYRYVGANPNNYVCFGSECSNEGTDPNYKNLYRIIGFFKNEDATSEDYGNYEMKIIKADAATKDELGDQIDPVSSAYKGEYKSNYSSYQSYYKGQNWDNIASYYWNSTDSAHLTYNDSTNTNMWKDSNLNTKNLNEKFYNAIDPTYKSMIVEHKWEVGTAYDNGDAKAVYDYELGDNKLTISSKNCYTQDGTIVKDQTARECNLENDLTYKDEVGLMYISDYMYGTLPEYWTTTASNYTQDNVKNNDWLYLGLYEWTISRYSNDGDGARGVYGTGGAGGNPIVFTYDGVRPVLYLSSNVKIIDGSGTDDDPFKLEM